MAVGLGCSSVIECLASTYEALCLVPSIPRRKLQQNRIRILPLFEMSLKTFQVSPLPSKTHYQNQSHASSQHVFFSSVSRQVNTRQQPPFMCLSCNGSERPDLWVMFSSNSGQFIRSQATTPQPWFIRRGQHHQKSLLAWKPGVHFTAPKDVTPPFHLTYILTCIFFTWI